MDENSKRLCDPASGSGGGEIYHGHQQRSSPLASPIQGPGLCGNLKYVQICFRAAPSSKSGIDSCAIQPKRTPAIPKQSIQWQHRLCLGALFKNDERALGLPGSIRDEFFLAAPGHLDFHSGVSGLCIIHCIICTLLVCLYLRS